MGQATYEPVPGSGSFLTVELPEGSTLLWATVDSSPVIPLHASTGEWSIALEDSRQPHVSLIWQTSASGSRFERDRTGLVGIPRVGRGDGHDLVTVYVPRGFYARERRRGSADRLRCARLEMARADWLARSINEFLPKIDRSSNRDHQKLVAMLIGHEMHLKSARRSESGRFRRRETSNRARGERPGVARSSSSRPVRRRAEGGARTRPRDREPLFWRA